MSGRLKADEALHPAMIFDNHLACADHVERGSKTALDDAGFGVEQVEVLDGDGLDRSIGAVDRAAVDQVEIARIAEGDADVRFGIDRALVLQTEIPGIDDADAGLIRFDRTFVDEGEVEPVPDIEGPECAGCVVVQLAPVDDVEQRPSVSKDAVHGTRCDVVETHVVDHDQAGRGDTAGGLGSRGEKKRSDDGRG